MPLFRHRPTEFATPIEAPPIGTLPCAERGCKYSTAVMCSYRDRRGRDCEFAFCPDHWAMVGGAVYCRRHASTISALGSSEASAALPALDNRGPSLVSWVADDLTAEVEDLLRATARDGETIKTERDVAVVFDHQRRRRWERSWKLIRSTGISLKVTLSVNEDGDDGLIDVRVGSNVIARGVPPWIARRRAGLAGGGQVDLDQRELFHRFFLNHIAEEVAAQRQDDSPQDD